MRAVFLSLTLGRHSAKVLAWPKRPEDTLASGFTAGGSRNLACHPKITEDRRHFEQYALTDCITCHKPHG
jgi:hypothetical protein